jgi:hypothetical protein
MTVELTDSKRQPAGRHGKVSRYAQPIAVLDGPRRARGPLRRPGPQGVGPPARGLAVPAVEQAPAPVQGDRAECLCGSTPMTARIPVPPTANASDRQAGVGPGRGRCSLGAIPIRAGLGGVGTCQSRRGAPNREAEPDPACPTLPARRETAPIIHLHRGANRVSS